MKKVYWFAVNPFTPERMKNSKKKTRLTNFVKDWASEAFGIVLLEYHNKNHLQGNDGSRKIAIVELMDGIMKLNITEEIRTHAQNVKDWTISTPEFLRDPKTQCEMIQNELLLIIGLEGKMHLFIRDIDTLEDSDINPS